MTFGGTTADISTELKQLLADLAAKRGPTKEWAEKEKALLVRIAACPKHERVWCRGEVHGRNRHYPAIVIYNEETKSVLVLAPSGDDHALEEHSHHFFWSSHPHIGIAKEVLGRETTNSTI